MSHEHQGLPVKGYVPQSAERVKLVNDNKEIEELVLRRIEQAQRLVSGVDHRWAAIAKTHIEEGFMCLNRSIFRPERLKLTEDGDAQP